MAGKQPHKVSIRLLRYAGNQGWAETMTGILRSPKATVAYVVTQERSSTETGMSWPVTCRQTWWTFWAAWPNKKKKRWGKKLQRGFNLQPAHQGVADCPSLQPITISQSSDTSAKCTMSKAKSHEGWSVYVLYPSHPAEEMLLLSYCLTLFTRQWHARDSTLGYHTLITYCCLKPSTYRYFSKMSLGLNTFMAATVPQQRVCSLDSSSMILQFPCHYLDL